MFIKFISHAGLYVEEDGYSLLIDPWFTDSTLIKPLLQSLSGHTTIDFQIPEAKDTIDQFSPHAILLSHFHAHHGPHADLVALAAKQRQLTIAHPHIENINQTAAGHFREYPKTELTPLTDQNTLQIGPFTITALSHTVPMHLAWHVSTHSGSIMHIADARINTRSSERHVDPLWDKFVPFRPHIAFISASGNSSRFQKEGVPTIRESLTMSPIEGAKIFQLLKPQVGTLIGCYNHSIWKNRNEYIMPAAVAEEQLYWAASWLAPEMKCIFAKPGHTYGIGDKKLAGAVDTFVSGATFKDAIKKIWNRL